MNTGRYVHYVASFKVDGHDAIRMSGVIDCPKYFTPVDVHRDAQLNACDKFGLDHDDYVADIVIEKMSVIE